MDAGEEGCIEAPPRHWHYIPTTLHSVVSHEFELLPRSSHEPTSVARITHDYSIVASYDRAITLSRP